MFAAWLSYSTHGSKRFIRVEVAPTKGQHSEELGPNTSPVAYKPLTLDKSLGVSEASLSANWIEQLLPSSAQRMLETVKCWPREIPCDAILESNATAAAHGVASSNCIVLGFLGDGWGVITVF